ncbi:MbnP family copper-binding protein [Lacibacterium aquatile]|uniref:MbnP family copper-binding protein n=1 Tax=Lacibacterium aquatile TaxID=1168082 RepID=A0ABW5DV63_9PROT
MMRSLLAAMAVLCATSAFAADKPVEIRFAAKVGDQPFICGNSYPGIGTSASTVKPSDFRFYVSEIALLKADGSAVPVKLTQDKKWQHRNVALLDFEGKNDGCKGGTAEVNDRAVGTVPEGAYTGIAFTLGLPFELNHADSTIADSPLNLTGLFWSWFSGYKFLRIDMETTGGAGGMAHGSGKDRGFVVHLGSTACKAKGAMAMSGGHAGHGSHGQTGMRAPESCANPNRPRVTLTGFDPAKSTIVADLRTLLSDTNVDTNQPNTPLGCLASADDSDCTGIFAALGLTGTQRFFRAE